MLQLDFNGGIPAFLALVDTKNKIQEITFSDQRLVNLHQIHTAISKMPLFQMERQWIFTFMVLRMVCKI
jgi:hypothetical protein